MTFTGVAVLVLVIAMVAAVAVFKGWAIRRHHNAPIRQPQPESPGNNVIQLPTQRNLFDRHADQAIALTADGEAGSRLRHPAGGPR